MIHNREHKAIQRKFWFGSLLLAALILATVTLASSQEGKKSRDD